MNAIDNIIQQMNETAEAERAAFEKAEREKIDQQVTSERARLEAEYEKSKARELEEIEKNYRQLRNRQQVEVRQATLNEKQEFLHRLFTEARQELENWSVEDQLSFMFEMVQTLSLSGDVSLFAGEKSAAILTNEVLETWNQILPFTLHLGERTIAKEAGFLIDDQGVQYNFIYSDLVQEVQEQMRFEIAKQLFE
ncbi:MULTISPECIES: V-type ATP synthase subunit E [Enterococcus]|uniref:V/A-type H+/Na+-transporting ATPase subunit E n=1 Tax=Candidatus Enterococcus mangumiae TaxID=2230878 RepID=A0ABZ2SSB7_9ENTE|nr:MULTISPECIES: V-type ATP synthase subunit E [unclassified Enterococcus]MBO0460765.1 V-type ATP synthase subunit E [Enterococcus sp. DIV1298c]MBO0488765.1 V-type ATP synthase subunit E [Enterococcus sp. DIV1094]MBO1299083.1 V-type ATP synthase subunit E [Enterococcus sp. DIV1271a]